MVSGLFAMFYAAGAWSAWRRNPMYSTRLTLRLVAVIALGVGAFFAAAIAASEFADRASSPILGAAAIASVCFFGGFALIWLILEISLPKMPAVLPKGQKLVRVNRAKLVPWAKRFAVAVAVLVVLAVALPEHVALAVAAIGSIVVLLGIVMLFTGYIVALNFDRSLTTVENDPWVHWRYTPEQWLAWSDVEVARIEASAPGWQWHRDWKALAIVLVAVAIPFVLSAGRDDWRELAVVAGGAWLLIVGLIVAADRYGKTAPQRLRRLLASEAPETYFGAGGLFAGGLYSQWQTMGNYLRDATIDERAPRSLSFVFVKAVSNGSIEVHHSVLIPAGAENDLERLQAALAATCPTARIALV